MKRVLLLVLLVGSSTVFCAEPEESKPDLTLHKGHWKLEIVYHNKGTRSEGQHGKLFYKDREFETENVGDETKTDLGLMKYYGKTAKEPFLPTGWNFADRKREIPSSALAGCWESGLAITGDLTADDIRAIVKAVAKEATAKISDIQQFKPDSAEVTTGANGFGQTFLLEKKGGTWSVIDKSIRTRVA